jgi:hypothetical protein
MKHLIIAAIVIWVLFQFGGMFWSSKDHVADGTFARFLEAPQRSIANPYHNGYFYLFGLTTAAPLDPAKTGYEIWVGETEEGRRVDLDVRQANRMDLAFALSGEPIRPAWEADDPLDEFRKKDFPLRAVTSQHQILLTRYEHWLSMPFEDWGFGRRIVPLGKDILAIHRLYIAEGFSLSTVQGLERLRKEFHLWRTVLRDAKTINTKVLAQVVIADDLKLLSRILAKPTVDKGIMTMGLQLTLPLSESEYSLRWPIRNEIALAFKDGRAAGIRRSIQNNRRPSDEEWLLQRANLPVHAFDSIEHSSGQGSDTYAAYYDAVIKGSESKTKTLPRMQEVVGTMQRGFIESLMNPHPMEPGWENFYHQLVETDTRLRLASLQIQLRRPSAQLAVPTRLAEVGSQYFDPFTGLPMLWSPTQQKLYSVGKDRLDDGGDPTFDISVPVIIAQTQVKPPSTDAQSVRR